MSDFKRGSEWRKWDLHIHTPESIVHEYKKGDETDIWEKYIKELESLPARVKVFLEVEADPNIAGTQGITPLSTATCYGYLEVTKLLIKYGANIVDTQENFERTALSQAKFSKQSKIVKILLEADTTKQLRKFR
jgi:ankyrin repeat protein